MIEMFKCTLIHGKFRACGSVLGKSADEMILEGFIFSYVFDI